MKTLETEQSQLTALRQDYLARAQAVIDDIPDGITNHLTNTP